MSGRDGEPVLMTIEEAAKVLRISARSAYRAIAVRERSGAGAAGAFPVPVFRPTPRRILVSRAMLTRYLETGLPVEPGG